MLITCPRGRTRDRSLSSEDKNDGELRRLLTDEQYNMAACSFALLPMSKVLNAMVIAFMNCIRSSFGLTKSNKYRDFICYSIGSAGYSLRLLLCAFLSNLSFLICTMRLCSGTSLKRECGVNSANNEGHTFTLLHYTSSSTDIAIHHSATRRARLPSITSASNTQKRYATTNSSRVW